MKIFNKIILVSSIFFTLTFSSFAQENTNLSFEDFMGFDFSKIPINQIENLKNLYKEIQFLESDDSQESTEKLDDLNEEFSNKLKDLKIDHSYEDFYDFLDSTSNEFTNFQTNNLTKLFSAYENLDSKMEELDFKEDYQKIQSLIDSQEKIVDRMNNITLTRNYNVKEVLNQINNDMRLLSLYKVKPDLSLEYLPVNKLKKEALSKEELLIQNEIWNQIVTIFPKEYLSKLKYYELNTDGRYNTSAYVIAEDRENKSWRISVDLKDSLGKNKKIELNELQDTLVHELGHLITLDEKQISPKKTMHKNSFVSSDGVATPESYIQNFQTKFWDKYKDFLNDESEETLYEKFKDEFCTEYASTAIEEDMAESFMYFVINPKPEGKSISDQKILFFYDYPELLKIKDYITQKLNR